MNRDVDPLSELTARLADALTTNRVRVQSGDGAIVVEATARGRVRVQLDDGALRTTGTDLSGALNELIARAVAEAQESAQGALAQFRADPRVGEAIAHTTAATQLPEPASELPDSDSKAAEATSTELERPSPPSRPAYSAANSDPDVGTIGDKKTSTRTPGPMLVRERSVGRATLSRCFLLDRRYPCWRYTRVFRTDLAGVAGKGVGGSRPQRRRSEGAYW